MEGEGQRTENTSRGHSGEERRQSWIWEISGELANEGDTGCGDTVLSPGTRQ